MEVQCGEGTNGQRELKASERDSPVSIRKPSSVLTRLNALSEFKRAQANLKRA